MTAWPIKRRRQHAFSLIELSMVLAILTLLAGGLMLSLVAGQETARRQEAERQLDNARDALLGFAAAHGRLPCPATAETSGSEAPADGGNCSAPWQGFLPALTLGLQPTDPSGYATDPWGNRIRYAITTFSNPACNSAPCISSNNGLRNAWNSSTPPAPDLRICNSAAGSTGSGASAECGSGQALTKDAVAVIFSRGRNGNSVSSHADEMANENNDRLFVAHGATASPNEFDDQVAWISANVLYSRLIAAGRLP